MRSFRNQGGPHSHGQISGKDGYFGPNNGWGENEFQSDPLEERRKEIKYIEIANNKLNLSSLFKKYNIQFDIDGFGSGWTHKCSCPFPDHNERTPSFGYNPSADKFNCFGCQRGGRSIQFVSYMEGVPQIVVAKNILGHLISFDDEDNYGFEDKQKIIELLFEYADCLQKFKRINNFREASKYADAVSWNLDVYLRKHAQNGSILLDDLMARIDKIKDLLKAFGESDE